MLRYVLLFLKYQKKKKGQTLVAIFSAAVILACHMVYFTPAAYLSNIICNIFLSKFSQQLLFTDSWNLFWHDIWWDSFLYEYDINLPFIRASVHTEFPCSFLSNN